jgi:hypothetical protein
MNDGTIIQAAKVTHDLSGNPPYILGVFKTDTMFNILNYLENDTGSVYNECITSSIDGKFLITGYCPPQSNYTEVDGLAIKVNDNLEYDSLYTFPFVYDSLCPYPIVTDTIDCDCDLITGYGTPIPSEERFKLKIYPNPAMERVYIRLNDVSGDTGKSQKELIVYDLYGRKVAGKEFIRETNLDTGSWSPGIYVVLVKAYGTVLAREKLIVL